MKNEEWKWIPGYENEYQVSNFGQVKSFKRLKKGSLMTGTKSKDGRVRVNLNGSKQLVHRLVLLTFKPEERTSDDIVLHMDGDPTNNCLDNLKWGTYKENANDLRAISRNKKSQQLSKERREQEQKRIIPDERWKDIKGYEGLYQISDYGRVKSFRRGKVHIMSLIKQTSSNYYTIGLSVNGNKKHYSIDRLVAEAFVDNPNNYPEVNHIDEDTLNNYYKNLEWVTHAQNAQHSMYRQCIPVQQFDLEGNFISEYKSLQEAYNKTGVSPSVIKKSILGRRLDTDTYIWKKSKE